MQVSSAVGYSSEYVADLLFQPEKCYISKSATQLMKLVHETLKVCRRSIFQELKCRSPGAVLIVSYLANYWHSTTHVKMKWLRTSFFLIFFCQMLISEYLKLYAEF